MLREGSGAGTGGASWNDRLQRSRERAGFTPPKVEAAGSVEEPDDLPDFGAQPATPEQGVESLEQVRTRAVVELANSMVRNLEWINNLGPERLVEDYARVDAHLGPATAAFLKSKGELEAVVGDAMNTLTPDAAGRLLAAVQRVTAPYQKMFEKVMGALGAGVQREQVLASERRFGFVEQSPALQQPAGESGSEADEIERLRKFLGKTTPAGRGRQLPRAS